MSPESPSAVFDCNLFLQAMISPDGPPHVSCQPRTDSGQHRLERGDQGLSSTFARDHTRLLADDYRNRAYLRLHDAGLTTV